MRYALLFYNGPEAAARRADPERRAAFWAAFGPYMKALQDAGIVVAGAGLQSAETATAIRHAKNGDHRVQDGPFADSKEQLAGFFIIDVQDLDAAMKWASRYPAGPDGGVEVRPLVTDGDVMLEQSLAAT